MNDFSVKWTSAPNVGGSPRRPTALQSPMSRQSQRFAAWVVFLLLAACAFLSVYDLWLLLAGLR